MSPDLLTPVERHGPFWVKREDLVRPPTAHGTNPVGGKFRLAWPIQVGTAGGVVGYGGRFSNTAAALAAAGFARGFKVRFHTAVGPDTPEITAAESWGAEVIRHKPGYLSVIKARAEEDAKERGWIMGPDRDAAQLAVQRQVANLRSVPFKRLVLAVGQGLTLAGVLAGLREQRMLREVIAVPVGAKGDLDKLEGVTVRDPGVPYEREVEGYVGALKLHPLYEAKVALFLKPGDLLWNLGIGGQE